MFNFFKRLKAYAFPQKKFNKTGHFKRLDLLGLEERITPASFVVSNLNDSGTGSLRQAIIDANNAGTDDTITFSTTGTITLASSLPAIVTATTAGALNITGPGSTLLTISGNNKDLQVFNISSGANLS
ncbi:MAG: hypothetical protein ACK47R_22370, partial [Planctomycetia bacterium]